MFWQLYIHTAIIISVQNIKTTEPAFEYYYTQQISMVYTLLL